MDPVGAAIRITDRWSPSLATRLFWLRLRRADDPTFRIMRELVCPGDVAVDIGAGWGLYTWALSQFVGRAGSVYAFEPNPVVAARLQRLIRRRPNVTMHRVAVSRVSGRADLHIPEVGGRYVHDLAGLSMSGARSTLADTRVPVEVERLDTFLASERRRISFVKCDVEGHELDVLRGGRETIERSQPSLLVEIEQRHHDRPIDEVLSRILSLGYEGYFVSRGGVRPLTEFDAVRDQGGRLRPGEEFTGPMEAGYVHDFLFVKPSTDVRRLLLPKRTL
jgi:FkbM family methyltransferase